MNSTAGHRHNNHNKQKFSARKRTAAKAQPRTPFEPSEARLLAFTIDTATAQVVKLEIVDEGGDRREISDEEKERLVRERSHGKLDEVLELAFEAGIACAIGEDFTPGMHAETDEEAELHHLLLARLMEHSAVEHLMRREALNRAVLEALIQNWISPAPAAVEGGTTTEGHQPDPTVPARTN